MQLREILHTAMKHTNAARSALNAGDNETCETELVSLAEFMFNNTADLTAKATKSEPAGPEQPEV